MGVRMYIDLCVCVYVYIYIYIYIYIYRMGGVPATLTQKHNFVHVLVCMLVCIVYMHISNACMFMHVFMHVKTV